MDPVTPAGEVDPTTPVIVLDHVSKSFTDYVAVHDADFSIGRGEFFSMLGPSGCGKTTTLRMIAGFEAPTAGRILIEGEDVSRTPAYKRSVNTVFQQYALFPHMNVFDNVAFGLRNQGWSKTRVFEAVEEMLEIVRMSDFVRRRPSQLSGGQQQRVALARALVNQPSALLLDEPLAALDLKLRQAMQLELKRIQRDTQVTFIFVTHDQQEALTMSDRIAVMSRGHVEQIGTPEDIYDHPATIFVAGFIGSANLLPAVVSAGSTPSAPKVDLAMGMTIEVESVGAATPGSDVTVMLRPERMTPQVGEAQNGRSVVGEIRDVIYQGSETRLIIDLDADTEIVVAVDPDQATEAMTPGNSITLTWATGAPFVLPGRTAIVGATSTDFDEVEATMAGELDADNDIDAKDGKKATDAEHRDGSMGRRRFLIGTGIVAAGALGAVALSSVRSGSGGGGSGSTASGSVGAGLGDGASELNVINWTEYIDLSEDGAVGSVERFEEETGVSLNYSETWNDNNEAYGKEFVAYLEAGNPTPWDIAVPTYWLVPRLMANGWLAQIPYNLIPNYLNLEQQYLNVTWDPGGKFNLPWQAGFTGFAYNLQETGRELKSVNDLFDPEFKGRVGFFSEMRDSLGLVMLGQGNDPATPTEDTINEALDKIEEATQSGHIRRFTGNDYLQDIQNGNFACCIAWSGDIAQATNPDVRFVFPEEGAMSWFDTMVIPLNAPNGVAAAQFMNFVYDPVNAAQIANYVQFISPVKGVRDELVKLGGDAAALADSPLLFPGDAEKANSHVYGDMSEELDEATTDRFLEIIGG